MAHVLVLHGRLPPGPVDEAYAPLLARLPYAKRHELERRDPHARRASLAGIGLALHGIALLSGSPAEPRGLMFPTGGKPYVPGGPRFSISHGEHHVGVALSRDCEVGFDLEEVQEPDTAPGATRETQAAQQRLVRWTATEAVLKAAARGLRAVGAVELDGNYAAGRIGASIFRLAPVGIAGTVAHIATDVPITSLSVQEVPLSAWPAGS
ncbi:MAG TPA: hypothetical protein PL152_02585 [Steroidobacteraceae bacterium]|nr:hypothetical protein [Steroidobacteraceae bacterium]